MSTPDDDATRAAIAIMTTWATDGTAEVGRVAAGFSVDPEMGDERLVTGFINLTGLLLTYVHGEIEKTPAETLQWIATRPWNERP